MKKEEKEEIVEVRCSCCNKKLCEKYKRTHGIYKILAKCSRCKTLNEI